MNAGLFSPDVLISDVRFRAERQFELGRGSDAVVYGGTWHGAPVAAKLLHEELLDPSNVPEGREALLTRFDQECQRLRRLRHPNIVQFLGVSRTRRDIPVLVTERMHASLLARYKGRPPLTPLLQFGLLRDTASGLSYIHSQHIVHRDLTPKNVLVTKDGRAKVADVGVARSLHGDRLGEAGMTQAPGTILYMPPEALVPQPVYDEQLDVFSYGVLMMSVILKREPPGDLLFSRRDEFGPDGRVHIIPEAARRAKDLRDIGRDHRLFGAINRCLENAPARRPSSSELFEELERLYCREEEATTTETGFEFQAASETVSGEGLTVCQAQRDRLLQEKEDLSRQRDDALQQQKELSKRLADITQQHNTGLQQQQSLIQQLADSRRQRDDTLQQLNDMTRQRDNSLQLQEELLREQQCLRDSIKERNCELRQLQQEHRGSASQMTAESFAAARFNVSLHEYQKLVASHTYRMFGFIRQHQGALLAFDDKWKSANSLDSLCSGKKKYVNQVFVHSSRLFAFIVLDGFGHLCQTRNLQDWHEVDIEWSLPTQLKSTSTHRWNRFVIHKGQVYRTCSHFITKENLTEIVLVQLLFTDEGCSAAKLEFVVKSAWQLKHHPDSLMFTSFSVGDSIVLAGELNCDRTCTYPTVIEFNMKTKQWVKNSPWPNLPEPVSHSTCIVRGEKVHLIGGVIYQPGSPDLAVSKVFTMDLVNSQPVGDWRTNDIPETPHAQSGAVLLHNHIIVAGGRHSTNETKPESYHDNCYALEPESRSWLRLPPLPYACSVIQLAVFQDRLVAVGGANWDEWFYKVNTWRINPN